MNNKGQTILFLLMVSIVIVILALALAYPSTEASQNAYSSMNCSNTTVNDYTKAGCYITDITPSYFIGAIILLGGIFLTSRVLFG